MFTESSEEEEAPKKGEAKAAQKPKGGGEAKAAQKAALKAKAAAAVLPGSSPSPPGPSPLAPPRRYLFETMTNAVEHMDRRSFSVMKIKEMEDSVSDLSALLEGRGKLEGGGSGGPGGGREWQGVEDRNGAPFFNSFVGKTDKISTDGNQRWGVTTSAAGEVQKGLGRNKDSQKQESYQPDNDITVGGHRTTALPNKPLFFPCQVSCLSVMVNGPC